MFAVINQIFVGLVGNDNQVALDGECRNLLSFRAREHEAAGVLRRVVINGARLGSRKLFKVLRMPLRRAVLVGTRSGRACAPVIRSPIGVQ